MNLFGVLDVSGSALAAERLRAEVVASNLANAQTTRTQSGNPYQRQFVVFRQASASPAAFGTAASGSQRGPFQGVRIAGTVADQTPPQRRYEPGHPDADATGYVAYPAINPIEEMVNLTEAARAYQLNVAAVQATKNMITDSLEILR